MPRSLGPLFSLPPETFGMAVTPGNHGGAGAWRILSDTSSGPAARTPAESVSSALAAGGW